MKTKEHKPEKKHEYNQKENGKNDTGRPSLYKPEYCDQIIAFFDQPKTRQILKSHTTGKNDYEKDEYITVPNELPTISKFARSIKVSKSTIYEWAKEHKEFSDTLQEVSELYKEFLNDNALAGYYNPIYSKFVAINTTDMKDKQETEITDKTFETMLANMSKYNGKNDARPTEKI